MHGGGLIHTFFAKSRAIIIEFKSLYAYESILFPMVSDAIQGIHALIDTREYHSPMPGQKMRHKQREIATIDPPVLNRVFSTFIQSFQPSDPQRSSRIIHVNVSYEDYLLLPSPPDRQPHVIDILGSDENQLCWELPSVQMRQMVETSTRKSFGPLCRNCSLFRQEGR